MAVAAVEMRLAAVADRAGIKGITIEAEGSTVTLKGLVESEDARRVAAALVALEPGVSKVKNELTVAAAIDQPASGEPAADSD
jgi:osmotically-inducible protein OsmY